MLENYTAIICPGTLLGAIVKSLRQREELGKINLEELRKHVKAHVECREAYLSDLENEAETIYIWAEKGARDKNPLIKAQAIKIRMRGYEALEKELDVLNIKHSNQPSN